MSDPDARAGAAALLAAQRSCLPLAWQHVDRALVRLSEHAIVAIGVLFTVMVTLEVVSRYLFDFSIFFVNAAARLLLVWFFLMGAGIALRRGAHVGFELVVTLIRARNRRAVVLTGQVLALVFFLELLWAGVVALGPALNQTEPGLEIRLFWAFLAIPVGFALLAYHMIVLMLAGWRRPGAERSGPAPAEAPRAAPAEAPRA